VSTGAEHALPLPGPPEPWSDADFRPVADLLHARQGASLAVQRISLLRARLRSRLQARGIPSFSWFHDRVLTLRPHGAGMQMLLDLSTINHTGFFREPEPLSSVADQLARQLRGSVSIPVRVWSAGCSAGQEPYSLAILLLERVLDVLPASIEILASDISLEMVRQAARAIYEEKELAGVDLNRMRRFFLRGRGPRQGYFRVVPELRRLVSFQHFDLRAADWPIAGEFDAILCRNVALYFSEQERLSLLDRLAARLRAGGWLVVGNCEILTERPGLLRKQAGSIFRKEEAR
jgi:chemotaxis protein methyltransferase CheR